MYIFTNTNEQLTRTFVLSNLYLDKVVYFDYSFVDFCVQLKSIYRFMQTGDDPYDVADLPNIFLNFYWPIVSLRATRRTIYANEYYYLEIFP